MSGQRLAHFFRNSVQSRNWMTAARWMDGVLGSLPLWALWMDKPTFACGFAFGLRFAWPGGGARTARATQGRGDGASRGEAF